MIPIFTRITSTANKILSLNTNNKEKIIHKLNKKYYYILKKQFKIHNFTFSNDIKFLLKINDYI